MSEDLKQQLAGQRQAVAVRNEHVIRTEALSAQLRQERADAAFARERRESELAGRRASLRARLMRSPERKAVALQRIGMVAMALLIPALVAFAVWSTVGVQAGLVKMMGIKDNSAAWWGAWFVEPALITVVAVIILVKARLREAGAETPDAMHAVEFVALVVFSLGLNVFGASGGEGYDGFWAMVGHALGPIACAMVAYLMGVVSAAITDAINALPIEAREIEDVTPEALELEPEPAPVAQEREPEVVEEATETVTRTVRRTTRGRRGMTDEERARAVELITDRHDLSMAGIAREVWGEGASHNKISRDPQLSAAWAQHR